MATPLSLSEVTNTYGTYRGNSLVGIRGAVGTVPNDGLEGINGVNYPFLEGIIVKINGASYTYSGYLNQLKLQGNPFISKSTIPTVSFTLDQLVEEKEDTIVYEGVTRTQYSEANVNKRMSSITDILFYLNDFFNPDTSDTVLSPYSIGGWDLSTTDYSPDLDVVGEYPGLQFEATPGLAIKPSTPPTVEEPKKPEPKPIIEVTEPKPIEIIKPKPEPAQTVTSTGIKINTPTGTFTGVNQNPITRGSSGGSLFDTSSLYEIQGVMRPTDFGTFNGQDTLRISDGFESFRF